MVKQTSSEAYYYIDGTGILSAMQERVYRCLCECGPMTGGELDDKLGGTMAKRGHFHKRLSELYRMNAVREEAERKCRITGRTSIVWAATSGPIYPIPKQQSKVDMLRELCKKTADYLEHKHETSDWTNEQIANHIRRRLKEIG